MVWTRAWCGSLLALLVPLVLSAAPAVAAECVVGGICAGSICIGGTPTSCPEDDNPCVRVACDPVSGCLRAPLTGPSCDDGDPCTRGDRCTAGVCVGQALRCADGSDCTEDRCVDGTCQHVPVDGLCEADECNVAACRPGDPHADRRGCVVAPAPDGGVCTDDGFPCTDDVCDAGSCLHVPIDSRCGVADACTAAQCAPERDERDATGCVAGLPSGDGLGCAEDGDPCSVDLCRSDRCGHEPVEDVASCAPIRRAFQKARGLAALARSLAADVARAPAGDDARRRRQLLERVERVETGLDTVAEVLAGRGDVPDEPSPGQSSLDETRGQRRARIAAHAFVRVPRHARAVAALLRHGGYATLRRRALALVRGVRALRLELARVRTTRGTFVRTRGAG